MEESSKPGHAVVNIIVGCWFNSYREFYSLKKIFPLMEIHNVFDDTYSIQSVRRISVVYGVSNINKLSVNENEFINLFGSLWMATQVRRATNVSLD